MVWVPMRVPDLIDLPTELVGFGQNGSGVGGVDTGNFASGRIADKKALLVRQTGKHMNDKHVCSLREKLGLS